jgi:MFS family permease
MNLPVINKNKSSSLTIQKAKEGKSGPGFEHSSPIYANVRVVAGFLLMTLGTATMYIGMVGLKPVAMEFGITRSLGTLPYALFMIGYGIGGIVYGRLADKFGILLPLLIGSLCVPIGIYLASISDQFWQYILSLSILAGLLGSSATFAPVISDISHWFTARRGLALSIVISGSYFSGALWPPILQIMFDAYGWREALHWVALISLSAMLPLSILFWRKPIHLQQKTSKIREIRFKKPLGFSPAMLQFGICCAGIGCCIAMSMPQAHIVSHATDLGFTAQSGAEMLSLMFGFGIISRLASGLICDKIGGLRTVILGSTLQLCVIIAFLGIDSLTGLYIISACFGLSQGGIVPSYAVIIRTYFPPREAGWRIGLALFSTITGMAIGAWAAGILYDITGSYTVSFINAVAFNIVNLLIIGSLVIQSRKIQSSAY